MGYLDIISLEQAKNYLKIDDGQTETDQEITRMIKGAFSYIEKITNHIMYARDKVYDVDNCLQMSLVYVYDFPINSIPDNATQSKKASYSTIYTTDDTITLNIGYHDPTDIPQELIEAAYQIIKVWFYESEKQSNSTLIPISVEDAISSNKRFII